MSSSSIYKVRNWSDYNKSLCNRGSLTIWMEDKLFREWEELSQQSKVVGEVYYPDSIIELSLTLGKVFHQPLRQTQGLISSIFFLVKKGNISVPDYTTLSRRGRGLPVSITDRHYNSPVTLVVDSTGLKVAGEGEWKVRKHGVGKRRVWRKLHLGVDPATNEILSAKLTTNSVDDSDMLEGLLEDCDYTLEQVIGDGAYDKFKCRRAVHKLGAVAISPPLATAVMKVTDEGALLRRNQDLKRIKEVGEDEWKREVGYHKRSLSEVAMFRYKTIIGRKLSAKNIENQITEAKIGCRILNVFSRCGMPVSEKIA